MSNWRYKTCYSAVSCLQLGPIASTKIGNSTLHRFLQMWRMPRTHQQLEYSTVAIFKTNLTYYHKNWINVESWVYVPPYQINFSRYDLLLCNHACLFHKMHNSVFCFTSYRGILYWFTGHSLSRFAKSVPLEKIFWLAIGATLVTRSCHKKV